MKYLSIAAVSALVAATATLASSSSQNDEATLFNNFITKFGKSYENNVEKAKRFAIFKQNLATAAEQQKKNPHATFGVNEFSDLSAAEFKSYHNADKYYAEFLTNVKPKLGAAQAPRVSLKDAGLQIDWRGKGAVTPIKNQGQCGSCWAFSTTGNLEGQWFLAGHPLTSLSEEFFVDCDTVDQGCNGGLPSQAVLSWLIPDWPQGRVPTEASYPYVAGGGQAGTCKKTGWTVGAVFQGGRNVVNNEPGMWGTLFGDGPISIGVDATSWQTYESGIMTGCAAGQLDHGVLIVGGNLQYHIPYWTIKNSWGTSWGEAGYIRVAYGVNSCGLTEAPFMGIVNNASIPTPAPMPPTPQPTPAPLTPVPPPSPQPAGWVNLFPPGPLGQMSIAMGLSTVGPRDIYVAGMVQGSGSNIGSQVARFDGQTEGGFTYLQASGLPFMEMELAIGGQPGFPKGAVCGAMFPIIDKSPFAYIANTTTVLGSSMPPGSFMSVVQGCEASPDGSYVFGADQGTTNSNMRGLLSVDGGKTFSSVPFGNVAIAQPNCTFPRYATIASEQVFYVTLGDWGSNNSAVSSAHDENMANVRAGKHEWMMTETRKIVRDPKTGKATRVSRGPLDVLRANKARNAAGASTSGSSSGSTYCGNSAEIIRTADGGKTWTNVFSSVDRFYFNEITCFDATHCIAVGEGFDEDAGVRIYRTTDGTNWERVFFKASTNEAAYSFFSVEVANSFTGEAWVGGTKQLPDQQSYGLLFHTTDFGKTWSEYKHQIPSLVEITQISCAPNSFGQTCFAVAMTTFQTSTIIRYDRTPVGPGPHPAQAYFTQKSCVTSKCDVLCQSIEFPQYMCLQSNNGGGVTAHCEGNNLIQTSYETTDCSGKGQNSEVPLNKCLSGSNGYFEFTCGTNSSSSASNFHTPRRMFNKNDKVRTL